MLTYTYISKNNFKLTDKSRPQLQDAHDAIVKVTLASICSSDIHIKHRAVPRAVEGITVGHDGWRGGEGRLGGDKCQGRRPRDGECGNLLRRLFLLP